jgi:hypothetical protein
VSAHGLPSSEHLLELLALRAVEGLNARDEAEVASFEDPDLFDEAASVIALALAANDGLSPMPAGLRARLEGLGPAVLAPAPAPLPFLAETKPTARPRRGLGRAVRMGGGCRLSGLGRDRLASDPDAHD